MRNSAASDTNVSKSLCLYVSMSLCLCVSVSLCLCVSVSLCLCVSVSLCLCISVSSYSPGLIAHLSSTLRSETCVLHCKNRIHSLPQALRMDVSSVFAIQAGKIFLTHQRAVMVVSSCCTVYRRTCCLLDRYLLEMRYSLYITKCLSANHSWAVVLFNF